MDSQPCSGRAQVNVRRGNEVMLERDNSDKLVSAVGAQSMYVLIAAAGHEDAEFAPPAVTATVAAPTSAAVLASGNARSGRIGVAGFTEDQRSISVASGTRPKAPERPHTVAQTPERTKPAFDGTSAVRGARGAHLARQTAPAAADTDGGRVPQPSSSRTTQRSAIRHAGYGRRTRW
jgi:hypothetical protein